MCCSVLRYRELSQFDRIDVQQDVVDYFERNNLQDKAICANSYLECVHLKNINTGFLHAPSRFKNVSDTFNHRTELIIFDNIEPDYEFRKVILKDSSFALIHRFRKNDTWNEIYSRK